MFPYVSNNTELPIFYHLIKTHKSGNTLRIRPIISNRNGPSHKLSWLLTRILRPLLRSVPAHLESSAQLMTDIESLTIDKKRRFQYPFSLDVVSLYTSVPPQQAIQAVTDKLNDEFKNICPFAAEQIAELLQVIVQNTYFTFKGNVYKQTSGLPIGSGISATLALLFMGKIEDQFITNCHLIGLYRRYVDDILILTSDKESAVQIFTMMNQANPAIQFEIEHPDQNNSLSLLDFRITICKDGATNFSFYKKSAKINMFPHAKSAIPADVKLHSVRNEICRIEDRCTSNEERKSHLEFFYNDLTTRGYQNPKLFFGQKKRSRKPRNPQGQKYCYFEFPFINDEVHYKVKRIFQSSNLPIRIYTKSRTIRSALQPKRDPIQCNARQCQMSNELCLRKNCVYSMTCEKCREQYIGSSVRPLHHRVREHLNGTKSSVHKHGLVCKANFEVKVMANDKNVNRLRFKEAILIRDQRPQINSKQEREELLHLLF